MKKIAELSEDEVAVVVAFERDVLALQRRILTIVAKMLQVEVPVQNLSIKAEGQTLVLYELELEDAQ